MKNLVIVIVLTLGAFAISANIENQTKIAFVDEAKILSKMEAGQEVERAIRKTEETYNYDREKFVIQLEQKKTELLQAQLIGKNEGNVNTSLEKEIAQLKEAVNKMDRSKKEEIRQLKIKLLTSARQKLDESVEQVAAKKGYKYVLNSNADGENRSVIISAEEDDLTKAVIEYMDLE